MKPKGRTKQGKAWRVTISLPKDVEGIAENLTGKMGGNKTEVIKNLVLSSLFEKKLLK